MQHYYGGYMIAVPEEKRTVGQLARTRTLCSGPCCGNPRRHFGELTRQERIAQLAATQDI